MQVAYVQIPRQLLFDPKLSISSKVVWMALQLEVTARSATHCCYARLARQMGVSRPTVYKAIRELTSAGWHPLRPPKRVAKPVAQQPWVRIPAHLLTDTSVPINAKIFYGMLKAYERTLRPEPEGKRICFTYTSLAKLVNWHRKTVSKAVRALAVAGWLKVQRRSRRAPAYCAFKDPRLAPSEAEVERIKRRLNKAPFLGEAIMREYLTLIVDSEEYEDNASPGFLVNPLTDERLQLDRYYPPSVAFEFNGPQHYGPTEQYSSEQVTQQRVRDLIKIGICATRGITLKVVHAQDLTLSKMREIAGNLLPLRDLSREGPRIAYLEHVARSYRRAARRRLFSSKKSESDVAS